MEILSQEALVFIEQNAFLLTALLTWSMIWKGLALWKASRLSHKWWFVIILLANTVGILEVIYIYFVASRYEVESKEVK